MTFQANNKQVLRKCAEDVSVCVPVEKYCDTIYDCPQGTDEISCSCEAWNMQSCVIGDAELCIYNEWMTESSRNVTVNIGKVTPCIQLLGMNADFMQIASEQLQCMESTNRTKSSFIDKNGSLGNLIFTFSINLRKSRMSYEFYEFYESYVTKL